MVDEELRRMLPSRTLIFFASLLLILLVVTVIVTDFRVKPFIIKCLIPDFLIVKGELPKRRLVAIEIDLLS